jgi:signal transduction histidine kinase/CheY-like chemotaxis protein
MRIRTSSYLAKFLVVLTAYFVTGRLGLSLDAVSGVAATVWPPSGIALAALLLGGRSLWPAVTLGALSVNLAVGVPAAAAAGIALGNTLEAVLGAHLVGRFARFREAPFDTVRDALVLVVFAAFLSTAVSASIGSTSAWLAGRVPSGDFGIVWWNWWVGDILGVLLVTPLVFGVRALAWQSWAWLRLLEACLALAVLCGVGALIFGADSSSRIVLHAYFVFPPLLWAALRFCQPGAAVATFVLAAAAILGTAAGHGPFVESTRAENLLALQTFMGSVALIVLVLGVMSTERARDLADRKQLESQLVIADRLAAVGTLAAGVGHEINNPLAFLIMNLDAAQELAGRQVQRGAEGARELSELLGTLQEGADRIRCIVTDLKTLARDEGAARGPTDVHKVLDSCAQIAGNQIRHRARLLKEYGRVPAADANEGRLAQVFLNLLINAAQAIPEGHADDNFIRVVTETDAEGRVVVEFSDSGVGIEQQLQSRLFEPFFTTKPVGEGIGLGLSVCHAIVTDLGGSIAVQSEPGAGTTFRVVLPAHPGAGPAATPTPVREGTSGTLRVLIVEDEARLAEAMARTLRQHEVTLADSGKRALELCKKQDYDLILCDLLMAEVTGMDVYEELGRLRPGYQQRMVFMTGGAFTAKAQTFLATVPNRTLYKPFTPDELTELVAEHIRRRQLG